ncbi:hypothetical protein Bca4012_078406 [Brassica carinata]|uniref:DUF1664 domain-containing protein n=3 Tax=Brassica TaxID=3705 RepID=A0A8X7U415_BRACI|nr:uncharacterized protein BNAC07G21850D [Brassica napus]KAG2264434.1 hypothetical protein Bca52824_071513 [Brassica carinata]CAF2000028.1 unnamed protein product [Brassica napus]
MAMQSGIGLTRILILAGAGYTSTILVKNGKMADLLGELQSLVKRFEGSGDHSDDDSDDMATQMQRLAMEVRQISSSRQITVMNGGAQGADFTPFIVPAATLGAIGYGYMWYKGMSFSDIMCVTKRSMEEAVSNLTKHLDTVSEAISNAKKHLSERLKRTDDKMELHKDLLKGVQDNVGFALEDLANIGDDFDAMHSMFGGMGGKLDSIEYKQNIANMGLMYLCDSMGGENNKMPDILMQEKLRLSGKSNTCIVITNEETSTSEGLKESDKIELLEG